VISGLQRDEGGARADVPIIMHDPRTDAYVIHPLAVWTVQDVAEYNDANDVYLHPLLSEGYPSIGCQTCTTKIEAGEDVRAGRWRHIREALEKEQNEEQEALYCNINWVDQQNS
ncbi:MAG: phosphoadenosine phosphosulfate reductase family protein, partial [Myxococcales bacterium]|nr:phosphoadenosine phosphosulfate reductase family protein [Myxococcales bacterium]